jgi:hypothetical protein
VIVVLFTDEYFTEISCERIIRPESIIINNSPELFGCYLKGNVLALKEYVKNDLSKTEQYKFKTKNASNNLSKPYPLKIDAELLSWLIDINEYGIFTQGSCIGHIPWESTWEPIGTSSVNKSDLIKYPYLNFFVEKHHMDKAYDVLVYNYDNGNLQSFCLNSMRFGDTIMAVDYFIYSVGIMDGFDNLKKITDDLIKHLNLEKIIME